MTDEGEFYQREEERENHMHVIGTTGEGKSRFLEHLIREDIRRGLGVCFMDGAEGAETAYNVLRYCAKRGHKKVCLIDPLTLPRFNRLTCVQPFGHHKGYKNAMVANMMDTVRVLFQSKDAAETPRIQRYLSAIFHALIAAEMTPHEAIYFAEYKFSQGRRREILSCSGALNRHRRK